MSQSSAYVTCVRGGRTYTWRFTGVLSVEHNLALNLNNQASQGADIVHGARNLANQVTLTVLETDTEHAPGWSAAMLAAMASLKRTRALCTVVTSMAAYEGMLLTQIAATQDGESLSGWSGELTFMEYLSAPEESAAAKEDSNSSVRSYTGTTGVKKVATAFLSHYL